MTAVTGCAYSRGLVETRAECDCPVCEASRYYRPMTDAIGTVQDEVRATRDARLARESDPVATAKIDFDVAMATARADEELAILRAHRTRDRAEENARAVYSAACKRHETLVTGRRAEVSRYASMSPEELVSALRMETFRLSRTTERMRADIRAESAVKVDAMRAELERRGVEIPRWKFQDRTVAS